MIGAKHKVNLSLCHDFVVVETVDDAVAATAEALVLMIPNILWTPWTLAFTPDLNIAPMACKFYHHVHHTNQQK